MVVLQVSEHSSVGLTLHSDQNKLYKSPWYHHPAELEMLIPSRIPVRYTSPLATFTKVLGGLDELSPSHITCGSGQLGQLVVRPIHAMGVVH